MGQATEREEFTEADLVRFRDRLGSNLKSLETLLQTPGFGDGPMSFGAEIELYIVDGQGRPLPINKELQQALGDKQLTLELNRFNLEYNFTPVLVRDSCFGKTEKEALSALSRINARAERRQSPAIERAALADGHGLAAKLIWPSTSQREPEYHTAASILTRLLPMLPRHLSQMGFVESDFMPLLDVISERLDNRQTGAQWQLDRFALCAAGPDTHTIVGTRRQSLPGGGYAVARQRTFRAQRRARASAARH